MMVIPPFHPHHIVLLPAVKNNIIPKSTFHKIVYSNEWVSLDAIYVRPAMVVNLMQLEQAVLGVHFSTSKQQVLGLQKYVAKHPMKEVLKISGIWETDTSIGLAFKLL